MKKLMYITTVLMFVASAITSYLAFTSVSSPELVSAAVPNAVTVDAQHSSPVCEHFYALSDSSYEKEININVVYAVPETTVTSSTEAYYDPDNMTEKERLEFLLRCNKAAVI